MVGKSGVLTGNQDSLIITDKDWRMASWGGSFVVFGNEGFK